MNKPSDHESPRSDGELERLVVECMERIEREGPDAVEGLCRENPDHADALRTAIQPLIDCGVVDTGGPPAETPRRIADFEIVREVGRGGMGVVFEARQTSLDRRVALKVVLAHLTLDETTIERFRREGHTLAGLRHPGIVPVHTVGSAEGHHFIAMEFVEGAPLDKVLNRTRKMEVDQLEGGALRAAVLGELHWADGSEQATPSATSWSHGYLEMVVGIAAEVADALEYAHRAGVVHRDVKPSNILVRSDGTPVLTDFGLAHRADLPGLTRTGAFAGTPYYTSPEQAGNGAVDGRSDVFSLGATLYELLTLQRPFHGKTTHDVLRAIQAREPIDPQKLNRTLAPDLAAVVLKALEKDPERRYRTAAAMAEDLRAFLAYRPVQARRATRRERFRRWIARQPLQATLVGVLVLGVPTVAALGGFVIANRPLVQAAERQQQRDQAEAALMNGYIAVGERRFADGLAALDEALSLEPENVEALAGKAYALSQWQQDKVGEALAALDENRDLLNAHRALQRVRAYCQVTAGQRREGEAELERLGEPQEPLETFWAGMRQLEKALDNDHPKERRRAYDYLHDAVVTSPRARPAFHYYWAAAAGALEEERTAHVAARALEQLWPDSTYAWQGIGLALYAVDPNGAVRAYRHALELRPDLTSTRNNLGNALLRIGEVDAAVGEFRQALDQKPDYGTAHYNLGKTLFARKGDPEAALHHLQRAVELSPELRNAHHYLIWVLSVLERRDDALAAADAALMHHANEPVLLRGVANVHLRSNDPDKALAAANRALAADPSDPFSHQTAAEAHELAGDLAAARRHLEQRITLVTGARNRARAKEDLAWFLLRVRDGRPPPDPAAALELALELSAAADGKDPWLLNLLGEALRLNDRRTEALDSLARGGRLIEQDTSGDAQELRDALRRRREAIETELQAGRK